MPSHAKSSPRNQEVPAGIGLQFIDPSPDLVAQVRAFIARREPAFYDE